MKIRKARTASSAGAALSVAAACGADEAEQYRAPGASAGRSAATLVVVAGLAGAGKTTLLRRVGGTAAALTLDSEDIAHAWARLPVPYRLLRPFLHGVHLARVLLSVASSSRCVLTTDPMTSPLRRRLLRAAAAVSGRRLVVVLVHATPDEARDGQRRRGRALGERRMTRHAQRYDALWRRGPELPADVVLTRDDALHVTR